MAIEYRRFTSCAHLLYPAINAVHRIHESFSDVQHACATSHPILPPPFSFSPQPSLPFLPCPLHAGPIPDLSQCVRLEELHLHENFFDGPIPESLRQCTRLKSLTLVKNCLEGASLTSYVE